MNAGKTPTNIKLKKKGEGENQVGTGNRMSAHLGSIYAKVETMQKKLAWPLWKDGLQIQEAISIFF